MTSGGAFKAKHITLGIMCSSPINICYVLTSKWKQFYCTITTAILPLRYCDYRQQSFLQWHVSPATPQMSCWKMLPGGYMPILLDVAWPWHQQLSYGKHLRTASQLWDICSAPSSQFTAHWACFRTPDGLFIQNWKTLLQFAFLNLI